MISSLAIQVVTFSEKINHIRAVAALWIFVFHYYHFIAHSFFAPLNSSNPFELLVYHGYFCVYAFFVLSGFLLLRAYPVKLVLKHYAYKRIGRLFPAYYLCIFVYILLFDPNHWDYSLVFAVFSLDLAVYPNPIGHLWFINRLLECYLLFPLLWYVTKKACPAGLFTVYLLCLLGGAYWVVLEKATLALYYGSLVLCLSAFILGMFAATQAITQKSILTALITLLLFASMMLWFHQSTWQTPLAYSPLSILWFNVITLFFAVFIKAYLSLQVYAPLFFSIILQQFGKISYTFYLYHFLVIQFFVQHREYLTTNGMLNFIGLFLLSIFSAVFFQKLLRLFTHAATYLISKASTNKA